MDFRKIRVGTLLQIILIYLNLYLTTLVVFNYINSLMEMPYEFSINQNNTISYEMLFRKIQRIFHGKSYTFVLRLTNLPNLIRNM